MAKPSVLISGGNGYLGLRLAQAILIESKYQVQLFVHASSKAELEVKSTEVVSRLGKYIDEGSLNIVGGELSDAKPFDSVSKQGLQQIIHSAAVTRFNVEAELAKQVNVDGSEKLLQFASDCPDLDAVQFLSTVYASGLRNGVIEETAFDKASSFSNHYERSKWEAEQLVSERFSGLPINVIRIATLIADNETGTVSQQNAFHNTLKLFYYGLLSIFPGEKENPVYFVTGDFVLAAVMAIFHSNRVGGYYHVCHQLSETAKLEQLVDTVFNTFESYPDFKIRRVLRPLWSDVESFEMLKDGISGLSTGVMSQAVSSVAPFARQLFAPKDFRNENLRALMSDYRAPDPIQLIENTARHLADTKWGRLLQNAK